MTFAITAPALARVGIATLACAFGALALSAPATAEVFTEPISIEDCGQPRAQLCKTLAEFNADVADSARIFVTAAPSHCSDIIAHVYIDGDQVGSKRLGPGESTREYLLQQGNHDIDIQAEGVSGGCNAGYLGSWGGTLTMRTGKPQLIDEG